MTKKPTICYKSDIHGEDVTAAQYITELLCLRLAKKKKATLSYGFWLTPEWKKTYGFQIICASRLLRIYPPTPIISALKNPANWGIFSLRQQSFPPMIEVEAAKLNVSFKKPASRSNTSAKPRPQLTKKNMRTKLDG